MVAWWGWGCWYIGMAATLAANNHAIAVGEAALRAKMGGALGAGCHRRLYFVGKKGVADTEAIPR